MGESSGSWSVVAHMVANDGDNEGLFSSAIGMSGGPLKVEGPSRQQQLFDDMVSSALSTHSDSNGYSNIIANDDIFSARLLSATRHLTK